MTDYSDHELVERVLNGDRNAYAHLVTRHQNLVYNVAYRMTGNHADAQDVAHEAFVQAFRKLEQYKPAYSFGNWVTGICANQSKNLFRSRTRRQKAEQSHVEDMELTNTICEEPETSMATDALQQLPAKIRMAITLRHMEGLSYEEIAYTLSIGVSAAKMRVKRGMEELLSMMSPTINKETVHEKDA
ncbi:MAG: sigma-70 family RNA polymerase sigma factor [Spartobacteria bacterium]|nr:sigma-70 family RNA polymerase sigma factor [Spartobacteria bacterium]